MPLILIIGAAIIGYSYLNQGKAAVDQIQYTPKQIKKVKLGLFSTTLDFLFNIENNTNTSATIDKIDGLLFAGTLQFGQFNILKPFIIPSGGNVDILATVRVTNVEAIKLIVSAAVKKKTPIILFKGGITTKLFGRMPFNYTAILEKDLHFKKKK